MTVLTSSVKHVPILRFFDIGSPATSTRMTQADFNSLMAWLNTQGYVPVKLSDYIAWMGQARSLPRKAIVLTFWGAFVSQFTLAYPELLSLGFPFNLMVPGAFVENEDALHSGIYFGVSELAQMTASGLAEVHSEGYHLKWLFQGTPAPLASLYKSNAMNLKWGGIEEFVEDAYSNAPLIGTNSAAQAVTTTYTFTCAPRLYLDAQPAPAQVAAASMAIDNLKVIGASYSPTVKVYAKRHADSNYTLIKNSWQPDWTKVFSVIQLDTPFTFTSGVRYDLQFVTQSAAGAAGELVILGSRTAGNPKLPHALWQASTYYAAGETVLDSNGNVEKAQSAGTSGSVAPSWPAAGQLVWDYTVQWKNLGTPAAANLACLCSSNSSIAGFTNNEQIGGDIYLLESLVQETGADTLSRVLSDAEKNLAVLAPWRPATQSANGGTAFGWPFDAYSSAGLFLPSKLSAIHAVQMFGADLLNDRWSVLDPSVYFSAPPGLGPGATTPVLDLDDTKGLSNLENQIDSFSGALWDVVASWDSYQIALGWISEFASDYSTERKKYAGAWTWLTSPQLRFNSDGVTLNTSDVAALAAFLALPEIIGRKVFARVTNVADSSIAHNIFSNSSSSIAAIQNLLTTSAPSLAGVALDIEGAAYTDRAIASSWITGLVSTRNANFPAQQIIATVPAKTADAPTDPWSGWCDYTVWLAQADYAAPLTYGYSDAATAPGPSSPLTWMQNVLGYASGIVAKSKLIVSMSFYGTYWTGGPAFGAPPAGFTNYYDGLQQARKVNATWTWDSTASEWFWADAAPTAKGYQPTPQSMKVRLDTFAALGYTTFGVWAVGQGDAMFYKYAEGATTELVPYLIIPQGANQSVTEKDGQSSVGAFALEAIDPNGLLKSVLAQAGAIGSVARLRMGFPGQALGDFVPLHTVRVAAWGSTAEGRIQIQVRDVQSLLGQALLWSYGGPAAWRPGQPAPAQPVGAAYATNAYPISDRNPRWLAGNPVDLLLVALQNEIGVGQNPSLPPLLVASSQGASVTVGFAPNPAWAQYMIGRDATLINPNAYLDVPGALALRDSQFSGDWMEFKLTRPAQAKQWLEDQILKPLGLFFITRADGRLALKSMKPPAPLVSVFDFTEKNLLGIPQVDRLPLVNSLTVRTDADDSSGQTSARDYQRDFSFIQETSINRFREIGQHSIESYGLRVERGGFLRAELAAMRLFARHAFRAAVYQVRAQLAAVAVEVGDFVTLTHARVSDPVTGTLGISNVVCEVLDRQPNYALGVIELKLLDLRPLSIGTAYQVARATDNIPPFGSASAAQKAQYMYICSAAIGGKNADGTPGNTIF